MIGKSTLKPQSSIPNSESILKSRSIPKHLPANDTAANLSSTSISDPSLSTVTTSNISTAAICNISTAVTSNLSTSNHLNTTSKLTLTQNPKTKNNTTKLEISDGCLPTNPQFFSRTIRIAFSEFSLLVTPEDVTTNNSGSNQQQALTNNIPSATVTNDKLLAAIFLFDLEETIKIPLFSRAAFEEKPITTMYTNAKIDGHVIKLILDNDHEKKKQKKEHTWETTIDTWNEDNESEFIPTTSWKEKEKEKKEDKPPEQITNTSQLFNKRMWNDIPGQEGMCDTSCQYIILISDWMSCGMPITAAWHRVISHLDGYPHDKDKIWWMVNAKVEGTTSSKILEIKNNPPEPVNIILVPNPDAFFNIETNSKDFHKHYQNLALTRKEQKEWLAQLNT
ncbi:hypothetical protein G9A89_007058 [Geosiphon pyriformis]|nr:hypothetical protein G9A89_007058 [Geosiphon pyriformis]